MAYRNFLLAFSGESAFKSSLDHAIRMTLHHDGWLTAVVRNGRPFFDRYSMALTEELREQLRQAEVTNIQHAVDQFRKATEAAGLADRAQFLMPDDIGGALPSEVARYHDLVITGFQSDLPSEEHRAASPDLIALRSGRPVLVVPNSYDASELADHALLAWDGKRSAARALGDAMSILETKPRVTVLTVGSQPETHAIKGLMRHLDRHGVAADHAHKPGKGKRIATQIEDTADEVGAKVVIMGAYEHSKFAQDIFGGVTHEVLKTTRVPVFMSH